MSTRETISIINRQIIDVEKQIENLKTKLDELRVAERVLLSLNPFEGTPAGADVPAGVPGKETIAAQIVRTLKENGPLATTEILLKLQEWRANLNIQTLNTTISRCKSKGEIVKIGDKFEAP